MRLLYRVPSVRSVPVWFACEIIKRGILIKTDGCDVCRLSRGRMMRLDVACFDVLMAVMRGITVTSRS